MTIGASLCLIAVGAILKWAVTAHVSWIDINTAGTVLFVIGLVGLPLALLYTFWLPRGRREESTKVVQQNQPPPYR